MMRINYGLLLLLPLLVAGCQSASPVDELLAGRKIDYYAEDTQKHKSLQYPPDLLSGGSRVLGTVSLSEYRVEEVPTIDAPEVVEQRIGANVQYRRDGRLRWVETDLPIEDAWGLVGFFWKDYLGFEMAKESPEVGIMETDWLQLRERLQTPGLLSGYLDEFFNRLQDSGERDKFVTRLERNEKGGSDIYVTHRHVIARFNKEGYFTSFEPQAGDPQLEIEMLRRILLHLSARALEEDNADIAAQIEAVEEGDGIQLYEYAGDQLWINKPFQESWQLAQVGLDRGGFSIEDRDYQERVIYIRHSGGPESEEIFGKAETNFFNKLFGEQKPILRDIRLIFAERDGRTRLTAESGDDEELTELQSSVILELLSEYLP